MIHSDGTSTSYLPASKLDRHVELMGILTHLMGIQVNNKGCVDESLGFKEF